MRPRAVRDEEPLLDQERLDDILQRAALLADGRGNAVDADRAAIEALDDGVRSLRSSVSNPSRIDLQQIERRIGDRLIDVAVGPYLRVVAHPAQQPVGDTRRAARALRDAPRAVPHRSAP